MPHAWSWVGSELTDFGTRRDLSVIDPDFLHSPGILLLTVCVQGAKSMELGSGQERGMFGERPAGIVWRFGKCHQFSRMRFVTSQSFELQGSLKCRRFVLGMVLVCLVFGQNSRAW